MKRKDKIRFLKTISALDNKINIREELIRGLNKSLKNESVENKKEILYDLLEGFKDNEDLVNSIISAEENVLNTIIEQVNNKITTNNPSNLSYISEKDTDLTKSLIKYEYLNDKYSQEYITNFVTLVAKNQQQISNYWLNPRPSEGSSRIEHIILTNKNLVDLLYLHFLNIYRNRNKENFKQYITQIQNNLKTTIALYIYITNSSKSPQIKESLIPFSIIVILTKIYNQVVQIYRIGTVHINQLFQIISNDKNLLHNIEKNLGVLKELEVIYEFLDELEFTQIDVNFKKLILEVILEKNLYTDEILIDFCILFSNNVLEKYKEIINNKVNNNKYWYKEIVLKNFESNNEFLLNDTFSFLQFIENWLFDEDIKEKVKKVIKDNIKKVLENDNIYKVFKHMVDNKELFNLNYTTKDIGKFLIETFTNSKTEDEKLDYILQHISNIFKEKELKMFISKLIEKLSDNLENINEYQYKILKENKDLMEIEETQIEKLFEKLIDIRNNKNSFLLFKLILEKNKQNLNENLKEDFQNKLEEIKENVEKDEIKNTIGEILKLLRN